MIENEKKPREKVPLRMKSQYADIMSVLNKNEKKDLIIPGN
jgi:hypothetical protein